MRTLSLSSSSSKKLTLSKSRNNSQAPKKTDTSLCSEMDSISRVSMRELVHTRVNNSSTPITELDLSWSLTADFERIKRIEGLEVIRGLRILRLSNNRIERIENLVCVSLTLSQLDLSHNRISSVDNLAQLSRLEKLNLSHNRIGELKAASFSNLKSLAALDLSHNCVTKKRDLYSLEDLAPTLQHLNIFGNPITEYREVTEKVLPGLIVLDNRNVQGSEQRHTSTAEASLTKYLRGSTTCNSIVEDSARQRKYLTKERQSASPGKNEELDPVIVKKLMKEIHSLKCENSMINEQLKSSQKFRNAESEERKHHSQSEVKLRTEMRTERGGDMRHEDEEGDHQTEPTRRDMMRDNSFMKSAVPLDAGLLPSQDTQQGPGSMAPSSSESKSMKRQLHFTSPGKLETIYKERAAPAITTPESLAQCREALLMEKEKLAQLREQSRELNQQISHLSHQSLEKKQRHAKLEDSFKKLAQNLLKNEEEWSALRERLKTIKESPAYQVQEKRELIKEHIREADELRERLLWEQKEIAQQKEDLHQKTDHLLLLRKQMNDRSIESYLSDSNCFFFEEERQSAEEIAAMENELTKREDAAKEMVLRIDHLTAQIPELETQEREIVDFLERKKREIEENWNGNGLEHGTPKFIEIFFKGQKTCVDEQFMDQALNPDTSFPGQHVLGLEENKAELEKSIEEIQAQKELKESEMNAALKEWQSYAYSLENQENSLKEVQRKSKETALRIEELERAIMSSPIQSLSYSGGGILRANREKVDTPAPFSAYTSLPANKMAELLSSLGGEIQKIKEKVSEIAQEEEFDSFRLGSKQLGLALLNTKKSENDAVSVLRPLQAPTTTITNQTIMTLETAISSLLEEAQEVNFTLNGTLQMRTTRRGKPLDGVESIQTTPTKFQTQELFKRSSRSPLQMTGRKRKGRNDGSQQKGSLGGTTRTERSPQQAIHIKENFMGKRSGNSMNSSLFKQHSQEYDLLRQSRDMRRIQSMLSQAKSGAQLDTSLMSEIQEEVARVIGQSNGLHDFRVQKQLYKVKKMEEYTQRLEQELNAAYDEIEMLQKREEEKRNKKNKQGGNKKQERMQHQIQDLELKLALLQSDVEEAEHRRDSINMQVAQMRLKGGKIVVDDKGCLVKYVRQAFETIMEIKAKKRADKENMKPRRTKGSSGGGQFLNFANNTTSSLIRSQKTPSPHSRAQSYKFSTTTPSKKCAMRSRSNTPRKVEVNEDAQLVKMAKEIRNYMLRLQRDFSKIYKVKENKDKLVEYFQKEAMELARSWALFEEHKAEMEGREIRQRERESTIQDLLMVASSGGQKSSSSLLPAQLLRQIEQSSPFRSSARIGGNDTSRRSHHSRGRSLDACLRKSCLNSSQISAVDNSSFPKENIAQDVVLKNLEIEISFYKNELQKLKLQVQKQQREREELQSELEMKIGQNTEEERKSRELAHELKTQQEIITQMQREKVSLTDALEKTRTELSKMQRERTSLQDSLMTLDQRKKRLHSTVAFEEASLQQEFKSLDSRVAERQQRLLSIQVGIERAQQEKLQKGEELKQMSSKLDLVTRNLASSEKEQQEHDIVRERLDQMREEISELSSQIVEREKNIRHLSRVHNELSRQNQEMNHSITDLQDSFEKKEQELKMVEGRIKSKQDQLAEAQNKLEEARERAQEVQSAARTAEVKLMQIEEDTKAKEQSFSRYKEELASFLDEMNLSRKNYGAQKRRLEAEIQNKRHQVSRLNEELSLKVSKQSSLDEEVRHLGEMRQEAYESFQELSQQQQEMQIKLAEKLQSLKERVKDTEKQLGDVRSMVEEEGRVVVERREEIGYLSEKRDEILDQIQQGNSSIFELRNKHEQVAQNLTKLEEKKNVLNIELALYGERPDLQMQERITQITKSAQEAEKLRKELELLQHENVEMSTKLEHYQEVFSDIKANSLLLTESGVKQGANSFVASAYHRPPNNTQIQSPLQLHGISFISGIDSARSQKSGTGRFESNTPGHIAAMIQQKQEEGLGGVDRRIYEGRPKIPKLNLERNSQKFEECCRSSRNMQPTLGDFISPNSSLIQPHPNHSVVNQHKTGLFVSPIHEEIKAPQSARVKNNAQIMKPIDDMIKRLDAAKGRIEKLSARGKKKSGGGIDASIKLTHPAKERSSHSKGSRNNRDPVMESSSNTSLSSTIQRNFKPRSTAYRRFASSNQENQPTSADATFHNAGFTTAATFIDTTPQEQYSGQQNSLQGNTESASLVSPTSRKGESPNRRHQRKGVFVNLNLNQEA